MSKNLIFRLGFALCLGLLATGCKTIDGRVKTHPFTFNSLSSSDRSLILKGQIRSGLPKSAVYLAWGPPNEVRRGVRRGHSFELWIYTTTQIVARSDPHLRSFRDDRYDTYAPSRHWSRFGISDVAPNFKDQGNNQIAYQVPYKTAFFENGLCTGWQFR